MQAIAQNALLADAVEMRRQSMLSAPGLLLLWFAQTPRPGPGGLHGADHRLDARGELHNLTIQRGGASSAEERYKINEHTLHTIRMRSALPFPEHRPARILSEAVQSMTFLRHHQPIDPDRVGLFIRSDVYPRDAHRGLKPEQPDAVDAEALLAGV